MSSPITSGPLAGVSVGDVVVTFDWRGDPSSKRTFPVTHVAATGVRFGRHTHADTAGLAHYWTAGGDFYTTTVRLATPAEAAEYRAREADKARDAALLTAAAKAGG